MVSGKIDYCVSQNTIIAVQNGATHIQLRNKTADKLPLYEIGKSLLKITRLKKISLIINDHIDLALALNADGVHIGQMDLPYKFARKMLGKNKIIGLSIQTLEHAKQCDLLLPLATIVTPNIPEAEYYCHT